MNKDVQLNSIAQYEKLQGPTLDFPVIFFKKLRVLPRVVPSLCGCTLSSASPVVVSSCPQLPVIKLKAWREHKSEKDGC